MHQLIGPSVNIRRFISALKKDKRVIHIEVNGNMMFMQETAKKQLIEYFSKEIFFVKPCVMDQKGVEHWELACPKKEVLMDFIGKIKPLCNAFTLLALKNTKLKDVYFPKVLPKLTDLQKRALELAVAEGYYEIPKKTSLRKLAKLSKVALATYQKHLQKAESKVMPDILSHLK